MRAIVVATLLCVSPLSAAEPKVFRDLPYTDPKTEKQVLDIYTPATGKDLPVIVWIHGGGWQGGDKKEVNHKPQACTDKGYVFVSVNYRLFPNGTIKQMGGDVARAIRWVRDHAREYGGDPDTLVVTGHSAGAQLAALVCTDGRYLEAEGLSLSKIKACVPVDGDTYDVPLQVKTVEQRRADSYKKKFGDEATQKDLSPITHVARGKGIPPVLILHVKGHPETTAQSDRLVAALKGAGVSARAYPAAGRNHVSLDVEMGQPGDEPTREFFEFLGEVLKK